MGKRLLSIYATALAGLLFTTESAAKERNFTEFDIAYLNYPVIGDTTLSYLQKNIRYGRRFEKLDMLLEFTDAKIYEGYGEYCTYMTGGNVLSRYNFNKKLGLTPYVEMGVGNN